jgi:sec-independent protein translocase protein TatA
MGGLGFPELLVIGVIALLVFGPRRLPEAGKALGQAIRGFKGAFEGREERRTDVPAVPGGRVCPGCAAAVAPEAAFCHDCGRPLSASPHDTPS